MPQLRRPLYQRHDGADEDRWGLVFDTDANRLFIEHEKQRGDMRGNGYGIDTDETDVAAFLNTQGPGRDELVQLIGSLLKDHNEAARP
jgi:hypothetical protein